MKTQKKVSVIYKKAGYSDMIITNIELWESQELCVEAMLAEYRYIQPEGELFSEYSLKIIIALYDIECMLDTQREIIFSLEKKLRTFTNLTFHRQMEFGEENFEYELI